MEGGAVSQRTAVVMHHYENSDLDRENLDFFSIMALINTVIFISML